MEMKSKTRKPKTQMELIHQWCNGLIDNYAVNSVEVRNDVLYYHNSPVAIIIKDFLFVKEFYNRGAYGNGLAYYDIAKAFNGSKRSNVMHLNTDQLHYYNSYIVKTIDKFIRAVKGKEKEKLAWAIDEFKHQVYDDVCTISNFYNRLQTKANTAFSKIYYTNNMYVHEETSISRENIPKQLNPIEYLLTEKQYEKFLNKTIEVTGNSNFYTGWSSYKTFPFNFKFKIKDYIENPVKAILSSDEIKEAEFRIWRKTNLIDSSISLRHSYDEAKAIWNDPDRKNQIEIRIEELIEKAKVKEKRDNFIRSKKNHISYLRSIVEWKRNNNGLRRVGYVDNPFAYLRLKFPSTDREFARAFGSSPVIQTSMHVDIDLEDGIKLYKLIKDIKEPKDLLRLKYQISGYYVKGIDNVAITDYVNSTPDDIKIVNVLCLKVGCHNIPLHEIHRFVKTNNILQYEVH
jgi:hypothetical protein